MRFHTQKNNVDWTHFFERSYDGGPRHKIALAAFYLHAIFLHGAKMRSAGKQRYVEPSLRHTGANVSADGACPRNQEFHWLSSTRAEATARRRIFPVAVVGMLSTR